MEAPARAYVDTLARACVRSTHARASTALRARQEGFCCQISANHFFLALAASPDILSSSMPSDMLLFTSQ
eukprot:3409775-Pleurochrysis_carterae.AAC.1